MLGMEAKPMALIAWIKKGRSLGYLLRKGGVYGG
jgi:hypothetical protein